MSATLNQEGEWNFRIIAKRLLVVKIKSESPNKLVVLDVISGLIFPLEAPPSVNLDKLEINHEYISNIQVYSSKNLNDIAADFMNFFETLDVEQTIDDFIKAYWVYPSKLRFVLTEIEEA
ncbi:MAG: hypothetical protein LBH79_05785 [Nitrososphaerota archaeon]|nr:hypothetical protein [Nitrososphaerota archaeon]